MHATVTRTPPRKKQGQGQGPRTMNGAALDVRGATAYLGWTEKQTRGMVARRLIPFRRLGGRIVFLRAELEHWLATLPGITLGEAQSNAAMRQGKERL